MIAEIIIIQESGINPVQAAEIAALTVALTILIVIILAWIIETLGKNEHHPSS